MARAATVFRLVQNTGRETMEVLKGVMIRAAQGYMPGGFILYYREPDGVENFVFTGMYKDNHAQAVKAAARISWRLMQAEDDGEGLWRS